MMRNLRWRLTLQFVLLTALVYLLLTGLGLLIFRTELTNSLDGQLELLLAELAPTVEFDGRGISLDKPPRRKIASQPFRLLATVQLYDTNGNLVEEHGRTGVQRLMRDTVEVETGKLALRSKSTPLTVDGEKIGYLQAQLPTGQRDRAIRQFGVMIGILTFLGIGGLCVVGYVFARRASEPLELSYSVLRQFSADAAHELGTPISTIKAAVENMEQELDDTRALKARLEVVDRASDRMDRLVRDLMLLTSLGVEAEAPSLELEEVNIGQVANETASEFSSRFKSSRIEFTSEVESAASVEAHRDSIARLITNLLENALRYTDEGGKVNLTIKESEGMVEVVISDTGIGIPAESIPKLFERFYRVDKDRSRAKGGSGLGLSIVKAICQLHHGTVSVESNPGKGSTFTVKLPAKA